MHYLTPTVFWLTIFTYENISAVYLLFFNQVLRLLGAEANCIYAANTLGFAIWTCLAEESLLVYIEREIQALFYPCPFFAFTKHWSTK